MARQVLKLTITGDAPLILHSGQTCDPLNKFSKALKQVSSKRAKTDADHAEMAKIEWYASLYTKDGKVCVPSEVMEAALVSGAKKLKLGNQAKATIFCQQDAALQFDGADLSVDDLWKRDKNRLTVGVRVGMAKVMRTRFIADEWSLCLDVSFDDAMLNESQVRDIIQATGEQVGLCDWRPKFGRFHVQN